MSSISDVPALRASAVGSRVARVEDPRLLAGRGRYVADLALPGMLHACFVRSEHGHARLRQVDVSAALAAPGVSLVWTGADVAPLSAGIAWKLQMDDQEATTQPVIAADTARFAGEAVAVVVANSRAAAEDAAALVLVDYEPLPAVVDAEAALADGTIANDAVGKSTSLEREAVFGDPDAALAEAALVVGGTFRTNRYAASPIEPRGCLAQYDWTSGRLTLWSSTQIPHFARTFIAIFLGLPEHEVEVIAPDVGGGFGQKAHLFPEELALCLLARQLDAPVKWAEDRRENLLAATHAKQQVNEMEIALDPDGRILALRDRIVGDGGAYNVLPWTQAVEPMCAATGNLTSVYRVPSLAYRFAAVVTNKCPTGAYRGVGWTAPQIARESLLDEAARRLSLSPFEIRRRNVVRPDEFPYTTVTGLELTEGSYLEALDALEELVGYEAFLERQRESRARGELVGLGISLFTEITGLGTVALFGTGFPVTSHDTSTVRVEPTGKVTVVTSLTTQGQGQATTFAQVAADALGVPLADVTVRSGDSSQTYGLGTWGSRAAVIGSGSIARAADVVRSKLLRVAGHMLEAAPEDLVVEGGRISIVGSPDRSVTVAEVATVTYFVAPARPADLDPTLEETTTYDPSGLVVSNGAHAALVAVDAGTGVVRVERFYCVEDCGVMINPSIVEGQIRGGIAQAIGGTLYEDLVYDEDGQLLTTSFMDYLLPTASEVPDVEIRHLETPSKLTPGGVKGLGESAMISAPAAIVNAVNDAIAPLGVALRDLPLTPERVRQAIRSGRG